MFVPNVAMEFVNRGKQNALARKIVVSIRHAILVAVLMGNAKLIMALLSLIAFAILTLSARRAAWD